MEAFNVGDVIVSKTARDEYTVVEVLDNVIGVRLRSSGMELKWFEKDKVKSQIAMGVFEMKQD